MEEALNPPVKIGDVLKLGVIRMGKEGDPVMVHKKFIIFLKNTEKIKGIPINTMIKVKITKVMPKFAFAEMTK